VDLAYFEDRTDASMQILVWTGFLDHFSTIQARWVNPYEHITDNRISRAAEYQRNMFFFGNEDEKKDDSY